MHRLLAWIGRNWPFRRGTGWLVERPARWLRYWPQNVRFRLKDGRIFQGDLNDALIRALYLYGDYEPTVSKMLRRLVRQGDVVVDAGANIGVMTALFGKLVGAGGRVYTFEPVPFLFKKLQETIQLNGLEAIAKAYPLAVGGRSERVTIYVPKGHSHACSSMQVDEKAEATEFECEVIALQEAGFIEQVPALVKVDVEGAEMAVLWGAEAWCKGERPPIWVLEINPRTAKRFGFLSQELVRWLEARGYRRFYWSDDLRCLPFNPGTGAIEEGTLYAVPEWAASQDRLAGL